MFFFGDPVEFLNGFRGILLDLVSFFGGAPELSPCFSQGPHSRNFLAGPQSQIIFGGVLSGSGHKAF